MPELSIENRIVCTTSQEFSKQFRSKSKPNKVYTASFSPTNPGPYICNWSCDCWPFKKTHTCLHVTEAQKCQCDLDGYRDYLTEFTEDKKCPKSQNDLTVIRVGV